MFASLTDFREQSQKFIFNDRLSMRIPTERRIFYSWNRLAPLRIAVQTFNMLTNDSTI